MDVKWRELLGRKLIGVFLEHSLNKGGGKIAGRGR